MTICGLAVYHKKFGQGTISDCENKVLTVVFPNLDASEQTKKFIFPDASSINPFNSSARANFAFNTLGDNVPLETS